MRIPKAKFSYRYIQESFAHFRKKVSLPIGTMSDRSAKKQKTDAPTENGDNEHYTPKNILLTGGAGEMTGYYWQQTIL